MTDVWTVVAGLGAAVGGIGAATSALFAWRSAKASQTTSRDALYALAVGIRPILHISTAIRPDEHVVLTVQNPSAWAANDIRLEVRYRGAPEESHRRERMDPKETPAWVVPLRDVKRAGRDGFDGARAKVESVVLSYSDHRDIARYRSILTPPSPQLPFSGWCEGERIK
jgi:hypothetical protein